MFADVREHSGPLNYHDLVRRRTLVTPDLTLTPTQIDLAHNTAARFIQARWRGTMCRRKNPRPPPKTPVTSAAVVGPDPQDGTVAAADVALVSPAKEAAAVNVSPATEAADVTGLHATQAADVTSPSPAKQARDANSPTKQGGDVTGSPPKQGGDAGGSPPKPSADTRRRSVARRSSKLSEYGIVDRAYVEARYELGPILGTGNFAVVRRCRSKADNVAYAMKIMDKSKVRSRLCVLGVARSLCARVCVCVRCCAVSHRLVTRYVQAAGAKETKMVESEVATMRAIDHENCIKLFDVLETVKELYLVMELVDGGDLFDRIVERGMSACGAPQSRSESRP